MNRDPKRFFDVSALVFLLIEIFLFTWGASGTRSEFLLPMFWVAFASFSCSIFGRINDGEKPIWRFPLFWISIAFIAIGVFQSINISGIVEQYQNYTLLRNLSFMESLPSSVFAPFDAGNAQSSIVKILAAFFVACSSFLLFQNRHYAVIALNFFSVNAALMGVFALIQPLLKMPNLYYYVYSTVDFYGSFYLTNAAGAFLNLGVSACVASAVISFKSADKVKGIFYSSLAFICAVASCLSESVGAILMLSLLVLIFILSFLLNKLGMRKLFLYLILPILILLGILSFPGPGKYIERKYFNSPVTARLDIYRQSLAYPNGNFIWGRGGSSYRHLVRPEIVAKQVDSGKRSFSAPVHPHSDIISYYFEYGIVGLLLFFLCGLWWVSAILSSIKELSWENGFEIAGIAICALHSCFDMNLSIPSVMLAFAFLLVLSVSPQRGGKNFA